MKDNTNALKVALIFTVIAFLIAVVVIYFYYSSWDAMVAEKNDATKKAQDAQTDANNAKRDMLVLKELITGLKEDVALQRVQEDFEKDMMLFAKTLGATERSYRRALANLGSELAQKNEEHKTTQNMLLELEANNKNLTAMYETVLNKFTAERANAFKDLNDARKSHQEELDNIRAESRQIAESKTVLQQEADEQIKKANAATEAATVEAGIATNRNKELSEILHQVTRITFDRPHGAIQSVNQQTKEVIINLGRADGLATRMTFTVYPPTITGISFASSSDPEKDSHLCEVCKRDQTLNASKASIEVVKILGEHKAQARILDDILTNPIVAGDVIYTPIWKPGQVQRFALAAGMRIPGVGQRDGGTHQSDLETIKNLITLNGGIVDAYISEGGDENKRGDLVGDITGHTTFLVLGDLSDDDNQDQDMMETQARMRRTAEQYAVKLIGLKEFLTKMGWKNVTPVRGFGQYATESDLRIMPRGGVPTAPGTVSPLYTPRNDAALVSPQDRPSPQSPGTVSPVYGQGRVPTTSSGTVSDLFRPRRPATGQDRD